jgi:hypothetical protein
VQRKTVKVNIAVSRPSNGVYFRVNARPEMILDNSTVVRPKEGIDRPFYFVVPAMRTHPKLAPRLIPVTIAVVYTWPTGDILLWPVPIPGTRDFKPWRSARAAYERAQENWLQMVWNGERADFDIETAEGIDKEPDWPSESLSELLKIAFVEKIIDNADHPYVRQLRGILD